MSAFAAELKIFSNCVELAVNENAAMVALEAFTEDISELILFLKSEFAVTYEGGLCQVFRCESKGHANKTILLVCKCLSCAFSSGGDLHMQCYPSVNSINIKIFSDINNTYECSSKI